VILSGGCTGCGSRISPGSEPAFPQGPPTDILPEIASIPRGVLGNQVHFLNPALDHLQRFFNQGFQAAASERASQLRDDAEAAPVGTPSAILR